jgi:hypothetical protein
MVAAASEGVTEGRLAVRWTSESSLFASEADFGGVLPSHRAVLHCPEKGVRIIERRIRNQLKELTNELENGGQLDH